MTKDEMENKIKTLNTDDIMDKLEERKLKYQIECWDKEERVTEYLEYKNDSGGWVIDSREPTPYGKAKKIQSIIRVSGLQQLLNKHKFENFTTDKPFQEHMKKKAVAFAKEPKGLFLIAAQSGIGKSHLSTAICGYLMLRGYQVRYMKWVDEIEKIKSQEHYHERQRLINQINESEVLYIDDFLKAELEKKATGADVEIAFAIIDYRQVNDLLTIISTEMTYQEIKERDIALAGRLVEMAKDNFITIRYEADRNYRESFLPKAI